MALDWGILYWIQAHLTCPFLDAVMPKFTLLGDAGIIWILAAVALLGMMNAASRGLLRCPAFGAAVRSAGRQRVSQASRCPPPPVLAR